MSISIPHSVLIHDHIGMIHLQLADSRKNWIIRLKITTKHKPEIGNCNDLGEPRVIDDSDSFLCQIVNQELQNNTPFGMLTEYPIISHTKM
jgi:hypothetical protein